MRQDFFTPDGEARLLKGGDAWDEASITSMSWSGDDLGQTKSKTASAERRLVCSGNGKIASIQSYGIQCCRKGLGEQAGRAFRPLGNVCFLF